MQFDFYDRERKTIDVKVFKNFSDFYTSEIKKFVPFPKDFYC